MANIMPHWISKKETPKERRFKYKCCCLFGLKCWAARRMRDWTWNHVVLNLRTTTDPGKILFSTDKKDNWDYGQMKKFLQGEEILKVLQASKIDGSVSHP